MVSQTILYKNDITGELFETRLEAVDAEFRSRRADSVQRDALSTHEDW